MHTTVLQNINKFVIIIIRREKEPHNNNVEETDWFRAIKTQQQLLLN